jgi:cytochrome c oxidase subunit 2
MRFGLSVLNVAVVSLVLGAGAGSAYVAAGPEDQVLRIVAKKFDFAPSRITLKKGVPIVLEFTSPDVLMGFNVPDLRVRTDIVPGQVARVRLVPEKAGTFMFFCDVFCGSGHEDMNGTITVVD